MRKFGTKSAESQEKTDSTRKVGGTEWFKNNSRPIAVISVILLVALILRLVFAYGVSAGSNFALSGGSDASYHLRVIEELITGGFIGVDGALFYPFGSLNANPPLMDIVLAAFAKLVTLFGVGSTTAAAVVLSWSAVIFGVLACIPMYFLGKEIVGTKTAGFLSALFLAVCPVVITQTVFSNGTEIAFIAFFFIMMLYFLVRGIKLLKKEDAGSSFKSIFQSNKTAIKYAGIAGLFLLFIELSWNGFRPIIIMLVLMMAIQALLDRFRGKDPTSSVMFFSATLIVGTLIAAPYYIAAGLWELVFSGPMCIALIAVVACFAFAATSKHPWTLTIPIIAVALVAVFVVLMFVFNGLYTSIVSGNEFYGNLTFGMLMNSASISLSTLAVYFGWMTIWFPVIALCLMFYKVSKNLDSAKYIFIMAFLLFGALFSVRTQANAVVFAPVYAVAFGLVMTWLFKNVDFKAYFSSFKGVELKGLWKKVLKPIPFASVFAVLLLICAPNMMYAVDASISNNDVDKYNDEMNDVFQKDLLGSLGYYIKTDSDWKVNNAFSSLSGMDKTGALVTWVDYAADSVTFGDFDSIVDNRGNGSSAMSNILLSNGSNGASTAAMLIYMMTYYGVDKSKSALLGSGMGEAQFAELKKIMENPSSYRGAVLSNPDKYGILNTDVSDENVMYIYGKTFLADSFSVTKISQMYEALCNSSEKSVSYVMVSGNMFPIYYGYNSIFGTLSYLNGYQLSDSYGTVTEFLNKSGYGTQYYGIYDYTESMYNTLLWRTYIGMSPAEAGITGQFATANYISALSLSDGTYKAVPGFGLSNYSAVYWHVMYNADSKATLASDGWVEMEATEAQALQEKDGGLINYLSGIPVILGYNDVSSGKTASGTITYDGHPAQGVRVAVKDSDGTQRATTFTGADGKYTVFVADKNSTIEFYAGSSSVTGGSKIRTIEASAVETQGSFAIPGTSISGKLSTENVTIEKVLLRFVGQTSKNVYETVTAAGAFSIASLDPDTYIITALSADGKTVYSTSRYLTEIGSNVGLNVSLDTAKITMTLKNELGSIIIGEEIKLTDTTSGASFTGTTGDAGTVTIGVTPGTYTYSMTSKTLSTIPESFTVAADGTKSINAIAVGAKTISITGLPPNTAAFVYSSGYTTTMINGTVKVPVGSAGTPIYGVYSTNGMTSGVSQVYWGTTADTSVSGATGYLVSGTLKSSSGSAVSGTITISSSMDAYRTMSVNTNSDGTYKVLLPVGTYTVYATNSNSQAYFGTLTVTTEALEKKDITMESAYKIGGNTRWYSSSYPLQYVPVAVSCTVDKTVYMLNLLSDSKGDYAFYAPNGSDVKLTVKMIDGGVYSYKVDDKKVYVKTIDVGTVTSSSSSNHFTADGASVTVKNGSSDYSMIVSGKTTETIEKGASKDIELTAPSLSVRVEFTGTDGRFYEASSKTMYVTPGMTLNVNSDNIKVTTYCTLSITGLEKDDVVSIKAMDKGQNTFKETGVYYLEMGKKFLVTVVNADNTKIAYEYVDAASSKTISMALVDSVTYKGFVGLDSKGTVTVTYGSTSIDASVSSGKYTVVLPKSDSYKFDVDVYTTAKDVETHYKCTKTVTGGTGSNTLNFAVTGPTGTVDNGKEKKTGVESVEMTIKEMSPVDVKTATIKFMLAIKADANTYRLMGGTDWMTLLFYDETGTEVTTVSGSKTLTAVGTINTSKVAAGSANLSVILKDLNGADAKTATFKDSDAGWVKTTATSLTTSVNYGMDIVNDWEYKYAVKMVNGDNYTKTFTVSANFKEGADISGWYITFVSGDKITVWAADSKITVDVAGYSEGTAYLKLTTIDGTAKKLPSAVFTVTTTEKELSTDAEKGITVSGNTATVESNPMDAVLKVSDLNADGRGVLNNAGNVPVFVWVIVSLIVLLAIAILWLGMRRGVFARKK